MNKNGDFGHSLNARPFFIDHFILRTKIKKKSETDLKCRSFLRNHYIAARKQNQLLNAAPKLKSLPTPGLEFYRKSLGKLTDALWKFFLKF